MPLGRNLSLKSSSSRKTSGSHSNRRESSEMVEQEGPRPAEVLSARFTEWKHIVKAMLAYFEGIVALEQSHSKELGKLSNELTKVIPLTEAWQFLPDKDSGKSSAGWSSAIHFFRDKNADMAKHHLSLADSITSQVVTPLKQLRVEIKDHVKAVDTEIKKLNESVVKERDASVKSVQDLALGLTKLSTTPTDVNVGEDPWIAKSTAVKQFHKQIDQENALTTLIIEFHKRSKVLEENIAKTISHALSSVQNSNSSHLSAITSDWSVISARIGSIPPLVEWDHFAALPESDGVLIPADAPLRSTQDITFPHIDDPATEAVFSGVLERKKRIVKNFKVAYYVLTPAGYLHEFKDSSEKQSGALGASTPTLSLFLPQCTLGATPDRMAKEYKWHIEGRNNSGSSIGSSMKKLGSKSKGETAHTFRAASYDEMVKWHDLMTKYAKGSLSFRGRDFDPEAGGPGVSAVRSAGFAQDDEESGIESNDESDEEEAQHSAAPLAAGAAAGAATGAAAHQQPQIVTNSADAKAIEAGHAPPSMQDQAIAAAQAGAPPPVPQRHVAPSSDGTTTTITTIHFAPGSTEPQIESRTVPSTSPIATSPQALSPTAGPTEHPSIISNSPTTVSPTAAAAAPEANIDTKPQGVHFTSDTKEAEEEATSPNGKSKSTKFMEMI